MSETDLILLRILQQRYDEKRLDYFGFIKLLELRKRSDLITK
jgi:hypothetical protein